MLKRLSMVACLLVLGGCALPVPLQIASWAIDGLVLVTTEKTVADHGVSMLAQRDCAMLRIATEGALCRDGTGVTAVAARELPPLSDTGDEKGIAIADAGGAASDVTAAVADSPDPAVLDPVELATFETAAGGVRDQITDEFPPDDVAIAKARWDAIIASPVFFDEPAELLVAEPKRQSTPDTAFEPPFQLNIELATGKAPAATETDFPFIGGDSLNLGEIRFDLQPYLIIDLTLVGGAGGDILQEQSPPLRDHGSRSGDRARHAAALLGSPCGRGMPTRRARSRGSGRRRLSRLSLRPPGPVRIVPPPGDNCLS